MRNFKKWLMAMRHPPTLEAGKRVINVAVYTISFNQIFYSSLRLIYALLLSMIFMNVTLANENSDCDVNVSNSSELQNAITNAVNSGKVICLASGTYMPTSGSDRGISFNITISDIVLRGAGEEATILSGNIGAPNNNTDNSQHVVTVRNQTDVTLKSLTISDGYNDQVVDALNISGNGWGAGLLAVLSDITLDKVHVRNNDHAWFGGGIGTINSTITIKNSVISHNSASFSGGGIYSDDINSVYMPGTKIPDPNNPYPLGKETIMNTVIEDNLSFRETGAFLRGNTSLDVKNSVIRNNHVTSSGSPTAGLLALGIDPLFTTDFTGSISIKNTLVEDNVAGRHGGLRLLAFDSIEVTNSTIKENTGGASAGLEMDGFDNGLVRGNTFEENVSVDSAAAILSLRCTSLTVDNNTFNGNVSAGSLLTFGGLTLGVGGAIYSQACDTIITKNTFMDNKAAFGGGAIYTKQDSISWFGHLLKTGGNIVELSKNTFKGNVAPAGTGEHILCDGGATILDAEKNTFKMPGVSGVVNCGAGL